MAIIATAITATKKAVITKLIREAIKLMEKALRELDIKAKLPNGRRGKPIFANTALGKKQRDKRLKDAKNRFNANKTWDNVTKKGAIAKYKRTLGYNLTQTEKNAIIKAEKRRNKK